MKKMEKIAVIGCLVAAIIIGAVVYCVSAHDTTGVTDVVSITDPFEARKEAIMHSIPDYAIRNVEDEDELTTCEVWYDDGRIWVHVNGVDDGKPVDGLVAWEFNEENFEDIEDVEDLMWEDPVYERVETGCID